MQTIPFTKMHGLGNNYVYIDCFKNVLDEKNLSKMAVAVSDVSTGIGSDGMILIYPSTKADVKMRIFNKDGSEAKNCGNGLRCVAKYAYENNYVSSKIMSIETISGVLEATISEKQGIVDQVSVNMGAPRLSRKQIPMIGNDADQVVQEPFFVSDLGLQVFITAVSMGNPHAVIFVPNIHADLHYTWGPKIERDRRFPERVNVEFVQVESSVKLHFRVWERGSGVTKGCGTGACAAVVAAVLTGHCVRDQDVIVCLEGGNLTIRWQANGHVIMKGPATSIATGILHIPH